MQNQTEVTHGPQMLHESEHPLLDLFGPTVQFLTSPEEAEGKFCILIGVIPREGFIPIHSHEGIECFFMLSGQQEVVVEEQGEFRWIVCNAGEFIQVPSGAKHGFLNRSAKPASSLIVTTAKLGRFYKEIGRPLDPGSQQKMPTAHELQHLMDAAKRFGYWMAPPRKTPQLEFLWFKYVSIASLTCGKPRLPSFQLRLSLGNAVPDYSFREGRRQILSLHQDRMNSRSFGRAGFSRKNLPAQHDDPLFLIPTRSAKNGQAAT